MPDYSKGKIYTIRSIYDNTLIYVGSTIQSLAVRWGGHKRNSKTEKDKNTLIYRTINDEWENWYIELYELYPCSCKEELVMKEGEIIRLMGTLNTKVAGRNHKEYYQENKDDIIEKVKNYYINNKDKKKEYHKEYYENNKEKILEQMKEKITCECGCIIKKAGLYRHLTSRKHINLIASF